MLRSGLVVERLIVWIAACLAVGPYRVMNLFYREFGDASKPPMVIVHGLLGSSRNWQAAGADLGAHFHVFCLDLRNHGESPHVAPHSYDAMVEDALGWLDDNGVDRPVLMGHSMGGKLAMKIACAYPKSIEKLIVVDIVPKLYPNSHANEYDAMRLVDLAALKSRTDAARIMEEGVPDWAMRQFLVTNLVKDAANGGFRWLINIDAIEAGQREIEDTPLAVGECYDGDTLFVMGGKSSYFKVEDVALIKRHFPTSALEVLAESGHNPHFELREKFVEIIANFAKSSQGPC